MCYYFVNFTTDDKFIHIGFISFWCFFYGSYSLTLKGIKKIVRVASFIVFSSTAIATTILILNSRSDEKFQVEIYFITSLQSLIMLFCYSLSFIIRDLWNSRETPVFVSPWIFPVCKLDWKSEKVKTHNWPYFLFLVTCILLFVCAVSITLLM